MWWEGREGYMNGMVGVLEAKKSITKQKKPNLIKGTMANKELSLAQMRISVRKGWFSE